MPLMAVVPEHGVDIGKIISRVLRQLNWTPKQLWMSVGYTEGDWSNAMAGRRSLDFWKLRDAPWDFWSLFLKELAGDLFWRHLLDLEGHKAMARASIPEDAKKEGRAS